MVTVVAVLALIALLLAIVHVFKPEYPLLSVAIILLAVALALPALSR